jgi:hypothetical protein
MARAFGPAGGVPSNTGSTASTDDSRAGFVAVRVTVDGRTAAGKHELDQRLR